METEYEIRSNKIRGEILSIMVSIELYVDFNIAIFFSGSDTEKADVLSSIMGKLKDFSYKIDALNTLLTRYPKPPLKDYTKLIKALHFSRRLRNEFAHCMIDVPFPPPNKLTNRDNLVMKELDTIKNMTKDKIVKNIRLYPVFCHAAVMEDLKLLQMTLYVMSLQRGIPSPNVEQIYESEERNWNALDFLNKDIVK